MSQPIDNPENPSSMASNSESMSGVSKLRRNSGDIGWEYGILIDPKNQDKLKCLKCGKTFSGGVTRMKQHIAGMKGNVAKCQKASEEDIKRCKMAIDATKKKKVVTREENETIRRQVHIIDNGDEDEDAGRSKKLPHTLGSMDKFASKINPDDNCLNDNKKKRQQSINDALYKERSLQVSQYMARWVYESGIPFHAVDNDAFRRFVEAVGQFGPGYQPPSQYQLREPLLKGEVERTKALLKVQEEEWERNGCSIMTDAWSDRKRRSIMNLCVNSRGGTSFLSSKEASLDAHTAEYIFEYVDACIEKVGEKNVVQVVTDNASNNIAASILLREKRPQIFWTPCATHSLNLMLEAIGKLPLFKNAIAKAKSFTIFIYSHHKTLALMRRRTQKEIVRPGVTRFASSFLTLQSLIEKKEDLKHMVTSTEWENTKWSKSKKGKVAYATILSSPFWNGVAMSLKVFTPLVKMLRLVDGDVKPAMGFVYGELQKAKEEIKETFKHKIEKYKPILDIVDAKIKDRLDTPLHLTAYLLNPYYYYNTGTTWSSDDMEKVMDGVFLCMERLYHEIDDQNQVINIELKKYKRREGGFGRALAMKACETISEAYDPVEWWDTYGNSTPMLQKVAKRILSLTTSSSGCERNWSVFEGIHTKKRNRLDTDRMNNLVYVQFNARLINKKMKSRKEKVDVLLANEASYAQSWLVDGVDDGDEEVTPGSGLTWGMVSDASGANEELQPRRSGRHVDEVRELDEDDFVSDGTEDDEEDEEEFDLESDKEIDAQYYENDENEDYFA